MPGRPLCRIRTAFALPSRSPRQAFRRSCIPWCAFLPDAPNHPSPKVGAAQSGGHWKEDRPGTRWPQSARADMLALDGAASWCGGAQEANAVRIQGWFALGVAGVLAALVVPALAQPYVMRAGR